MCLKFFGGKGLLGPGFGVHLIVQVLLYRITPLWGQSDTELRKNVNLFFLRQMFSKASEKTNKKTSTHPNMFSTFDKTCFIKQELLLSSRKAVLTSKFSKNQYYSVLQK